MFYPGHLKSPASEQASVLGPIGEILEQTLDLQAERLTLIVVNASAMVPTKDPAAPLGLLPKGQVLDRRAPLWNAWELPMIGDRAAGLSLCRLARTQ